MQHKRNIFLSHSGAQKAFVRRLRIALESNAYLPFFDENPDCLRKGEAFAQHIKIASRLTDVGVVVVSGEYLRSKWPMIELAIFVEEQKRRRSVGECKELKILPLFWGLSVKEFREAMRQSSWLQEWKELSCRDNRIDISAWEEAVKVLGGHNGLEYCDYKTEEDYIGSIVSAIFYLVPPDLKLEDSHVKGKGRSHQVLWKALSCEGCSYKC